MHLEYQYLLHTPLSQPPLPYCQQPFFATEPSHVAQERPFLRIHSHAITPKHRNSRSFTRFAIDRFGYPESVKLYVPTFLFVKFLTQKEVAMKPLSLRAVFLLILFFCLFIVASASDLKASSVRQGIPGDILSFPR